MRVRRASGGVASPATRSIEQLLLDRLAKLLVSTRRERVQLKASASVSVADGVKVNLSAESDGIGLESHVRSDNVEAESVGLSNGQEIKSDGTVRGAAVAVWLRQAVLRALSPAVYVGPPPITNKAFGCDCCFYLVAPKRVIIEHTSTHLLLALSL